MRAAQLLGARNGGSRQTSAAARGARSTARRQLVDVAREARRATTPPPGLRVATSSDERVGAERERGEPHRRDHVHVPAVTCAFGTGSRRQHEKASLPRARDTRDDQEHHAAHDQRDRRRELTEVYARRAAPEQHDHADHEHEREHDADAGHLSEPRECRLDAHERELHDLRRRVAPVVARVLTLRSQLRPDAVGDRQRRGMEQRHPPTSRPPAQEHRERDDHGHGDCDTRAQQTAETCEQADPVARSIGPSWSANKSCVSPNTNAPVNVIWNATRMFSAPDPKNTKVTAAIGGQPGAHARAPHDHEYQRGGDEVRTTMSAWYGV